MPSYVAADGAELHVEEYGDPGAPPLLVLAGGAARHPVYLGTLGGLDATHRLVVPHVRGVGGSVGVPGSSYWDQALDLEALCAQLGLASVPVLGHSAGTRLAMAFAARFPPRVSRLAVVTPPCEHLVDVANDVAELVAARAGDADFEAAWAAYEAGPEAGDDASVGAWLPRTAAMGFAAWTAVEQEQSRLGEWHVSAARAFMSADVTTQLRAWIAGAACPVLVVAGAQDCITGFTAVAALAAAFPHGELATIEACGHFPWVEQPAAFRAAVEGFLRP